MGVLKMWIKDPPVYYSWTDDTFSFTECQPFQYTQINTLTVYLWEPGCTVATSISSEVTFDVNISVGCNFTAVIPAANSSVAYNYTVLDDCIFLNCGTVSSVTQASGPTVIAC